MATNITPLGPETLEQISKVLDELTNSEITHELKKVCLTDPSYGETKWVRLYNAFVEYQNTHHCSDSILQFCINYFKPVRFVNKNPTLFEKQRTRFNRAACFDGWEISEEGKLLHRAKTTTISKAEERAHLLQLELENRSTHSQVFKYCTPEILHDDYFHIVEEAVKGLFERVRDISGVNNEDGAGLIDKVLGEKSPIILINNFQSKSEISEHKGFSSMLKSLYSLFRNPEAHSPRERWQIDKVDTLDILGIISLCHRKLDRAYRIQLP